jgi:hypothetical protein
MYSDESNLQMPQVNQDLYQDAPEEQQIEQPLHSQNCETSGQHNGLGELLWEPGLCKPLLSSKEYSVAEPELFFAAPAPTFQKASAPAPAPTPAPAPVLHAIRYFMTKENGISRQ